jgi:pyruvate kinase
VRRPTPALKSALDGMAYAAVQAATAQRANPSLAAIVVLPSADISTGTSLAKFISAHRPHVPVFAMVPNHKEGRLLQMHKCLHPVLSSDADPAKVSHARAHCVTLPC